jgi:MYXO-CTERM domain-containing protein
LGKIMLKKNLLVGAALAVGMLGTALGVRANTISFLASGSGSDGPLSASVTFTALAGKLEVTLANTLPTSGTVGQGQAISSLSFSLGSGVGPLSAFTELTGRSYDPVGTTWTAGSGTAFDAKTTLTSPLLSDTHWGFSNSSGDIVATAGATAPGGNPAYMIIPSAGTWKSGGGGTNFDPYVIGPANFFFTASNITVNTVLTTSNITGLKLGFGTSPDTVLTEQGGTVIPNVGGTPTPLPKSAWAGLALLGLLGLRRKTGAAVSV